MRTLVFSQALGGAGESALMLALSTVFGALSLLLAAAWIYGVIYLVKQSIAVSSNCLFCLLIAGETPATLVRYACSPAAVSAGRPG